MQGPQGPEPFGDYILLERIAVGGMAELFRGELTTGEEYETPICIKRILPHYSDDENFVNMFIDEATIAAQLAHPNIVKIYDFNAYDGSYYIAMELVDGKDLKQTLELAYRRQTRLTAPMIAYISRDIVSALHYAHARRVDGKPLGIIHRDVSPHNVLLGFNGDVKLTDFGIAKAASRLTHTRAGTVKGKCAYMSPEQARGKTLDGRSDLFGVGILMHEMLTGRRLFTGESDFEILTKVIRDPIPKPSDLVPGIDPELEQICLKTLEREREHRWRDGLEMEAALNDWMRARGVDHSNTGLDRFVQTIFGRADFPLPQPGEAMPAPSKQEEMALAAAMPTAMLTPDLLPDPPSGGPPAPSGLRPMPGAAKEVDPNLQRTQALDMPPLAGGGAGGPQLSGDKTAIFDLDSAPDDFSLPSSGGGYDNGGYSEPDYSGGGDKHESTAVFDAVEHELPPQVDDGRPAWFNAALIAAIFGVLALTVGVIAVGAVILKPALMGETSADSATTAKSPDTRASDKPRKGDKKDDAKKDDEVAKKDDAPKKDDAKKDDPKKDDSKAIAAKTDQDDKAQADDASPEKGDKKDDDGAKKDDDAKKDDEVAKKDDAPKKDDAKKDDPKKDDEAPDAKDDKAVADQEPKKDDPKKDDDKGAAAKKGDAAQEGDKDDNAGGNTGLGTITIKATPWADVFLDGRRLGRTPINRVEVSTGKHVILFKNGDLRQRQRKDIEVASGEDAVITHDFK